METQNIDTHSVLLASIKKLRPKFHLMFNDTYIWVSVASNALGQVLSDEEFLNNQNFLVPSTRSGKTRFVKRKPDKVRAIIHKAQAEDLFNSVFVYLVAQVEAFLSDFTAEVLRHDPRRLKTNVNGIQLPRNIDIKVIIDNDSLKDVLDFVIQEHLAAVFYARPAAQFEYLERVIGVELDDSLKANWIEFKATRDLIVHNSSKINQIYLDKCGASARGELGEMIVVDRVYFEYAFGRMKSLIGRVVSQLETSFKS